MCVGVRIGESNQCPKCHATISHQTTQTPSWIISTSSVRVSLGSYIGKQQIEWCDKLSSVFRTLFLLWISKKKKKRENKKLRRILLFLCYSYCFSILWFWSPLIFFWFATAFFDACSRSKRFSFVWSISLCCFFYEWLFEVAFLLSINI